MNLFLIRGLPGSGKSTLARCITSNVFAADDYFYDDKGYNFNASELPKAHKHCQDRVKRSLELGLSCAVANTFSRVWEMGPYLTMAEEFEARLFVIDLYDGGLTDEELVSRNVHNVPITSIQMMRDRWERWDQFGSE